MAGQVAANVKAVNKYVSQKIDAQANALARQLKEAEATSSNAWRPSLTPSSPARSTRSGIGPPAGSAGNIETPASPLEVRTKLAQLGYCDRLARHTTGRTRIDHRRRGAGVLPRLGTLVARAAGVPARNATRPVTHYQQHPHVPGESVLEAGRLRPTTGKHHRARPSACRSMLRK